MSANTRREKNDGLARFASLYAQNVTLIEQGKRDSEQVSALITSMQLFKENRLLVSIPRQDENNLPSPEQLQQVLSLHLRETALPRIISTLLIKSGVEYVGELYLISWERRGISNSVRNFLTNMGLPHKLDLNEVSWIPPYANRDFSWRMNQHFAVFIREEVLELNDHLQQSCGAAWFLKFENTGEIFSRGNREWRYGNRFSFNNFRWLIKPGTKLRAGMYCPKSWQPSAALTK